MHNRNKECNMTISNFRVDYIKVRMDNETVCVVQQIVLLNTKTIYRVSQIGMYAQNLLVKIISDKKKFTDNYEYYKELTRKYGYDLVIKGIKDLRDVGALLANDEIYRKLVIDEAKEKYENLYRNNNN